MPANLRRLSRIILILLLITGIFSCDRSFKKESAQQEIIAKKFEEQKAFAQNREQELFSIFQKELTTEEREALEFLYAYLPMSDLADLNGEYLLRNVKLAFQARAEMPWGKSIPDEIFRHFVLPHRVNRENLDSARAVFFSEIKPRVKGLNMIDAVLEVNHWCHEKVTYRSTSYRVSSPLMMIPAGFGRCGEESIFTVTALRSVCIPARTCYTPRWAHCDDNHAWIEIWADGKWYYAGACEPSPKLNMGWFTKAAGRAMFVFNQVYGDYYGPEELVYRKNGISQVNSTSIYAPTKKITVQAIDTGKQPIPKAKVGFMLYNYGEFYSCLNLETDAHGYCATTTGLGDLLIWAMHESRFGYKKITVAGIDTVRITPVEDGTREFEIEFDMVPPVARQIAAATVTDEEKKINSERLKYEDQLRADFAATWLDSLGAASLAQKLGLDKNKVCSFIERSRGNWKEIADFLTNTADDQRQWAMRLLETLTEKDFRDTKTAILADHLKHGMNFLPGSKQKSDVDRFVNNVLAPRVRHEFLLPYRSYFIEKLTDMNHDKLAGDPSFLVDWVKANIEVPDRKDRFGIPMNPIGIFELKKSDKRSIGVLYAAINRTFGIASRLEPATKKPQVWVAGDWQFVELTEPEKPDSEETGKAFGYFILRNLSNDQKLIPEYEKHFSIGRLSNEMYRSLDFYRTPFVEFKQPKKLEAGNYLLATGNRLSDGTVMTRLKFLNINPGEKRVIDFIVRSDEKPLEILGHIKLAHKILPISKPGSIRLQEILNGKGALLMWIEPDKEPSKHALNDLCALKANLEKWGGGIIFSIEKSGMSAAFDSKSYRGLPEQTIFALDENYRWLNQIRQESGIAAESLNAFPIFILIDKSGNAVAISAGYRIGVGEQMLKAINKLK